MNQWLLDAFESVSVADRAADNNLRAFFTNRPGIGARDRRLIADYCFDMLRHFRCDTCVIEAAGYEASAQYRVWLADARGQQMLSADTPDKRDSFHASLARVDTAAFTTAERFSLPDWLAASLIDLTGEPAFELVAARLLLPGALDIRVNTEKVSRAVLQEKLQAAGISFETYEPAIEQFMPDTALRVAGHPALERTEEFRAGFFEVQDAGSQLLARLAGVRRGQTVVDFCAGGGGKALAFAALMRNTGNIYCCDVSQRRLRALTPRMNRAGVTSIRPLAIRDENDPALQKLVQRADVVFVDAPCTGTGTLRRNPGLKWQVTPELVAQMAEHQRAILMAASRLVRPGGRLIYATCSILHDENEAIALAFEAGHPAFERLNLVSRVTVDAAQAENWPAARANSTGFVRIWPHIQDCDAYFAAGWQAPR